MIEDNLIPSTSSLLKREEASDERLSSLIKGGSRPSIPLSCFLYLYKHEVACRSHSIHFILIDFIYISSQQVNFINTSTNSTTQQATNEKEEN